MAITKKEKIAAIHFGFESILNACKLCAATLGILGGSAFIEKAACGMSHRSYVQNAISAVSQGGVISKSEIYYDYYHNNIANRPDANSPHFFKPKRVWGGLCQELEPKAIEQDMKERGKTALYVGVAELFGMNDKK